MVDVKVPVTKWNGWNKIPNSPVELLNNILNPQAQWLKWNSEFPIPMVDKNWVEI